MEKISVPSLKLKLASSGLWLHVAGNDDEDSDDNLSDLIDEYYKEYDASLTGMKAGLDNRHRKMRRQRSSY